jgi:hypothetical protein
MSIPTQMPFTDTHNGQSTERNAAEEVMMYLKLDNTDFRQRDPIVNIIGQHIDKERAAKAKPEPDLRETVEAALALPQDIRELFQRLTSLSTAAHVAASTLLEHGENGLASCDNVDRLYKDVQLVLKKFDPPSLKQAKVWSLARLSKAVDLHAMHNRRKNGPICLGCSNTIGFYKGIEYLGAIKMIGRSFTRMQAGDLVSITQRRWVGKPQQKLLTIDKIEGLMVHLKELSDDDRARAKNAQDPVDPGLSQGPRFVPPRTPGNQ